MACEPDQAELCAPMVTLLSVSKLTGLKLTLVMGQLGPVNGINELGCWRPANVSGITTAESEASSCDLAQAYWDHWFTIAEEARD